MRFKRHLAAVLATMVLFISAVPAAASGPDTRTNSAISIVIDFVLELLDLWKFKPPQGTDSGPVSKDGEEEPGGGGESGPLIDPWG